MANDKKKPRKKLKTKKVGVGDPTLRVVIELTDEDDSTLVENLSLNFSVNIGTPPNPILSLPFANLPTCQDIILMAGFNGTLDSTTGTTLPINTVVEATPNTDYDLVLADNTGLGAIENGSDLAYGQVTKLLPQVANLQNDQQVVFQSREGEDQGNGQGGIYVFLAKDNHQVITDCYCVTSDPKYIFDLKKVNGTNDTFTIFNNTYQQYLGYSNGTLGWLDATNTGATIEWKIESFPSGSFSFSIQNLQAVSENVDAYLTATPTTHGGNIRLQNQPSAWYLHTDVT